MTKGLIIFAHGSRRQESNVEVKELAVRVTTLSNNDYDEIGYAYLELAEPDLLQSIDKLVQKGIKDITVMPYFLNSGNHVMKDLPELIEKAKDNYSDCVFQVSPCIGMIDSMPELILEQSRLITK